MVDAKVETTVHVWEVIRALLLAMTMAGLMADLKAHSLVETKAASRVVLLVGKWVGKSVLPSVDKTTWAEGAPEG